MKAKLPPLGWKDIDPLIIKAYQEAVLALAQALESRNPYTRLHSERVAILSVAITSQLGLNTEKQKIIQIAGQLHDIGKIGTPDAILLKAGPLADDEWQIMKIHPLLSRQIVEPLTILKPTVAVIVSQHHERVDGSGYPLGLTELTLGGRILAVSDSFDALLSKRPYRDFSYSMVEILFELMRCSNSQFDFSIISILLETLKKGMTLPLDGKDQEIRLDSLSLKDLKLWLQQRAKPTADPKNRQEIQIELAEKFFSLLE